MNNFHESNTNKKHPLAVSGSTIDLGQLDNVREGTNKTTAACPACRELGRDTKGDHLVVYPGGQFTCVLFPVAATDSKQHRQRIFQLVGGQPARGGRNGQFSVPDFAAQTKPSAPPTLLGGVVLDPPARTFIHADRDLEELTTSFATARPREIALAVDAHADGSLDLLAVHAPPATHYPTIIEVGRLGPAAAARLLEQLIGRTIVVHGAQTALRLLARWQPEFRPEQMDCWCTWTAAKLLSNGTGLDCDLDPVLKRYLSMSIARQGKDATDNSGVPRGMCHSRVADSVRHLVVLKQRLAGDMTDMRMEKVFALESALLPITHDLNRHGWQIDLPTLHAERARLIAALDAATSGEEGPLRSRITQTGQWLSRLSPNGRLRGMYDPLGAVTGRYSACEPNLQNVPRGPLRKAFCAGEGHSLVIGDLGQIELRVAALAAGDTKMLAVFRRGDDLHRHTAAAVLGKSLANITNEERQVGKVVNFGLIFGQGVAGFIRYASEEGVMMTVPKAERLRQRLFEAYPGIAARHQQARDMIRSGPMALGHTVLGRRRFLPHDASDWDQFQAYINYCVQGSAAELFKTALVELHPQMETCHARLVGIVHDEVIVETPTAKTAQMAQRICLTFEDAFVRLFNRVCEHRFGRSLPELFRDHPACEVQTYVCMNWAEKE